GASALPHLIGERAGTRAVEPVRAIEAGGHPFGGLVHRHADFTEMRSEMIGLAQITGHRSPFVELGPILSRAETPSRGHIAYSCRVRTILWGYAMPRLAVPADQDPM